MYFITCFQYKEKILPYLLNVLKSLVKAQWVDRLRGMTSHGEWKVYLVGGQCTQWVNSGYGWWAVHTVGELCTWLVSCAYVGELCTWLWGVHMAGEVCTCWVSCTHGGWAEYMAGKLLCSEVLYRQAFCKPGSQASNRICSMYYMKRLTLKIKYLSIVSQYLSTYPLVWFSRILV